jgi:hypothetical protein
MTETIIETNSSNMTGPPAEGELIVFSPTGS